METLSIFLQIVFFYLIINTIIRMFMQFKMAKKVKEQALNEELNRVAEPVKIVEEMVHDKICGVNLPRSKSYIIVKNDHEHYFCSWECRQKFLDSVTLEGAGNVN
ncbi:transcriptional regulator [Peptococcaceae bacterium 1198_IL3148]